MSRELYLGTIPVIRNRLDEGFLGNPVPVRGGAIDRDYDADPVAMSDAPDGIELLSDDECIARQQSQEVNQSSLMHLYMRGGRPAFPLLDQNGHGYCWAYSTGHAVMLDRLKQNLPPIRINPHATAAIIMKGQDRGGWCGLSQKFGREHGWAVEGSGEGQWPLHSRDLRRDTPALRASMALHKTEEEWYDLGRREWDQKLSRKQIQTLAVNSIPIAADWMRHSHSMCLISTAFIDGRLHPMVLNSWRTWGYFGLGVLYDQWPDNAVALRASTPSDR